MPVDELLVRHIPASSDCQCQDVPLWAQYSDGVSRSREYDEPDDDWTNCDNKNISRLHFWHCCIGTKLSILVRVKDMHVKMCHIVERASCDKFCSEHWGNVLVATDSKADSCEV